MSLAACAQGGAGGELFELSEAGVAMQAPPQPDDTQQPFDAGNVAADPPALIPQIPAGTAGARPDAGTGAASPGGTGSGIKPVDGGTAAPRDAATTPAADSAVSHPADATVADTGTSHTDASTGGNGQTCSTTPAYATTDACSKCICSKCSSQIAACYSASTAAQCGPIQTCAQTNHCTGEDCYCGVGNGGLACLFPAGACVDSIQTASGGTLPTDVQTARDTAGTPVALANDTGTCTVSNCRTECGLP